MFEQYDDILTMDAFMEILAIGRNKAYKLLQTGQIKSLKVGKAYRIPKHCVEEYVMNNIRRQLEQSSSER